MLACICLCPLQRGGRRKGGCGRLLRAYLENDLFSGTEEHYTSGFKQSRSSHDSEHYCDSRYASQLLPLFNILPYLNETTDQKILDFSLSQNSYTPVDTEAYSFIENDRPYADGSTWKSELFGRIGTCVTL